MSDTSGWTVSTLERHLTGLMREHRIQVEQRFVDSEKAVQIALMAAEKAADKQEKAAASRHTDLVEHLDTTAAALYQKFETLAIRFERTEGRSGGREQFWGWMVAAVAVTGGIVGILVGVR